MPQMLHPLIHQNGTMKQSSSRKVSGLTDPIVDWKKTVYDQIVRSKMAKFEPWPYCHLSFWMKSIKFTESLSSLRHRAPLLPLHPVPCITSPRVSSSSIGSCHTSCLFSLQHTLRHRQHCRQIHGA